MSAPCSTVTVAICTWNRSQSLRHTLAHLTGLRVPPDTRWELLIVNNNCTDDTDRVCEAFRDRLPIRILHEPRPGQSHARNLAIREARGSYLAWTDDDVLVDANWLEALLDGFRRDNADWVFGRSTPEWPGAAPTWYSPRFSGMFALLDYGPAPIVIADFEHPFYGLNFAGTLDAHLSLQGFRTEFGFRGNEGGIGEDIDMFERAIRAKMRVLYNPAAHVRHVIPAERLTKQYHRRRQWVANVVYFEHLDELFPGVPWLIGLPRFFFGQAARDALGYARCAVSGDASGQFHYEMQLLRFIRLGSRAATHGFKRPARPRAPSGLSRREPSSTESVKL